MKRKMIKVEELYSWRAVLFTLLNSDRNPESVLGWICSAYKVPRDEVVNTWVTMLCAKHGV